jgi:hypothetical protein
MATVSELEAALANLRASADELNKLDDELTAMIPEIEDALRGLRLGVRISVQIEEGEQWSKYLAFDKHGQTWRLLIEGGPDDGEPEQWTTTALANVPRDERADVFEGHLDKLLLSAAGQIKTKAERRRRALEGTRTVIATVKKAAAPRVTKP